MKTYLPIEEIEMMSNDEVYSISLDKDFLERVKEGDEAPITNKEDALYHYMWGRDSIPVTGWGIHSGRPAYCLPVKVKNQVKKLLEKFTV